MSLKLKAFLRGLQRDLMVVRAQHCNNRTLHRPPGCELVEARIEYLVGKILYFATKLVVLREICLMLNQPPWQCCSIRGRVALRFPGLNWAGGFSLVN